MRRRRTSGLSVRDRAVLDLERHWGPSPTAQAAKFDQARSQLGLDPGGYNLILNALLQDPAARAHDGETVDRLRALRQGYAAPGSSHPPDAR